MSSKAPTSVKSLTQQIERLEKEREELFAQRAPIDKAIEKNYGILEKLREKRGKMMVAQMPKDVIDFDLILNPDLKSQSLYREADRQVMRLGLYRSGYFEVTKQACLKLMMYKNRPENLQKTYDSVMLALPHIKPHPSGEFAGCKVFSIFESTLSAHGSYFFLVAEGNACKILRSYGTRYSEIGSFSDIMTGLTYVQKKLYYQVDEDEE